MTKSSSEEIHIRSIGYVERLSPEEDDKDRSLVSKIMVESEFAKGLDGIEEWSHVYVVFWMQKISNKDKMLIHLGEEKMWEYLPLDLQFVRTPLV